MNVKIMYLIAFLFIAVILSCQSNPEVKDNKNNTIDSIKNDFENLQTTQTKPNIEEAYNTIENIKAEIAQLLKDGQTELVKHKWGNTFKTLFELQYLEKISKQRERLYIKATELYQRKQREKEWFRRLNRKQIEIDWDEYNSANLELLREYEAELIEIMNSKIILINDSDLKFQKFTVNLDEMTFTYDVYIVEREDYKGGTMKIGEFKLENGNLIVDWQSTISWDWWDFSKITKEVPK